MRWSEMFIPTLRESPAEADAASHRLLVRAGYARPLAAGVFSWLPLGRRALGKIAGIIRAELAAIGALEVGFPLLQPAELWQESGRWESQAATMFRVKDRGGRAFCLAMTNEEAALEVARRELRSYKQLPQIWFQVETKFRDEPRPRGVLRLRQFRMADSYSFDLGAADLAESCRRHVQAYRRILDRCGVAYVAAEAPRAAAGDAPSLEFAAPCDAGDGSIARCAGCGYAATLAAARSRPAPVEDDAGDRPPEPFATPGVRTIEQLAAFTGADAGTFLKTLAWMAGEEMVLALVRGDDELNEVKLAAALGDVPGGLRPAPPEEILARLGAEAGFIGPVGAGGVRILADETLRGRRNLIAGANRDDTHLRHVTPGRDFTAAWADLRTARAGEGCPRCDGSIEISRAIELAHVHPLGTRLPEAMGARVLDAAGKETPLRMGSFGIGIERLLAAAVEQHHDDDGLALPAAIAPFAVALAPTNLADPAIRGAAEKLYAELRAAGIETLFDDRDERPGVKFKDADLVGIPWRITVGKKVQDGNVELRRRSTRDTRDATLSEVVAWLQASLEVA
jgi:prolyl-tRNA synthetase